MKELYTITFLILMNHCLWCQNIANHFDFSPNRRLPELSVDELFVRQSYASKKDMRNNRLTFYTSLNGRNVDSLIMTGQPIEGVVVRDNLVFCLIANPNEVVKIDKASGKIVSKIQLPDSIYFSPPTSNVIIGASQFRLYEYDPMSNNVTLLFNLLDVPDLRRAIRDEIPIGIGEIFPFSNGRILIETGIVFTDGIDGPQYFFINKNDMYIKKVSKSTLEPLVAEPREKLRGQPEYSRYIFDPDIRTTYYDISDTLLYVKYDFQFEYRSADRKTMVYKEYEQDPFVLNYQCKVVGRALERRIYDSKGIGFVNRGERKEWLYIRSVTDSGAYYTNDVVFKIKISYQLEKCFYEMYHNKILDSMELAKFDRYELLLLRNFIFAKHNYKFKMPFLQAYYNTFAFYSDEVKRSSRLANVDNLLTTADKKNLELITIAQNGK